MGHDSQILTNNLLWTQSKQQIYIICSIRLKCNIPCLPFNHRLSHLRTYDLLLWSNICYILHMFRHFPQTDSTDVTYLHRIQWTQFSSFVHSLVDDTNKAGLNELARVGKFSWLFSYLMKFTLNAFWTTELLSFALRRR